MYDDDEILEASDEQVQGIGAMAKKAIKLQREIEDVEAELKRKNIELARILEKDLPMALQGAGLRDFTTEDGRKVEIKEDVFASISEAHKPPAHNWLRDNGHGSMIKNEFRISFTKNQDNEAVSFEEDLKQRGVDYKRSEAVHVGTLRAFVKEQISKGTPVPMDLFSVHVQSKAVIK